MRPNLDSGDNHGPWGRLWGYLGGLGPPYLFFFDSVSRRRKSRITSAAASAGGTNERKTTLGNKGHPHYLCKHL
jgi:hypothetical protein